MLQINRYDIENENYNKKLTVYLDNAVTLKGSILYFHGGGLIFGSREDLPELHVQTLTSAGYAILAFDYPLAPTADLEVIFQDVCDSVQHYLANAAKYVGSQLPYFLWGRSAGAYLSLLAAAKGDFFVSPHGVISYYGYGLLCDSWFQTPSAYYNTLPPAPAACLENIGPEFETEGPMETHFLRYLYARQTGTWKSVIFPKRDKYLYLHY